MTNICYICTKGQTYHIVSFINHGSIIFAYVAGIYDLCISLLVWSLNLTFYLASNFSLIYGWCVFQDFWKLLELSTLSRSSPDMHQFLLVGSNISFILLSVKLFTKVCFSNSVGTRNWAQISIIWWLALHVHHWLWSTIARFSLWVRWWPALHQPYFWLPSIGYRGWWSYN